MGLFFARESIILSKNLFTMVRDSVQGFNESSNHQVTYTVIQLPFK